MQSGKFYLKARRDQRADGTSLVYLSATLYGVHRDINTQVYVPQKNWDHTKRRLKASRGLPKDEALKLMQRLQDIEDRAKAIWETAGAHRENIDHDELTRRLGNRDANFNFITFCREYIKENPRNWSEGTTRIYADSVNWLEKCFGPVIRTEQLEDLQEKFEKGMFKKLGVNTRRKHHKHVKFFLGRARRKGVLFKDPYQDVSLGCIKGNRNYLNLEDLSRAIEFYQKEIFAPHLQECLRQFLFSCFTGCRYSDMVELSHRNIVGRELHYVAVKTQRYEKRIEAPLPAVAQSLIHKVRSGRLFEMRTDQITNNNLKSIFRKLQINKHITFHCARHTFGTLYIYLGGEITNLQEIMGHSKLATTQVYTHMARRMDAKNQNIFDKEFAKKMKVIINGRWKLEVA